MLPRALILHAPGSNRDHDVAQAISLAGLQPVIVPLTELRAQRQSFGAYQMLVVPGGFSYADALGAGRLLALDLKVYFADEVRAFVATGKPVIGICNGFQALVKANIFDVGFDPQTTLTFNASGHFECRWVTLKPTSQRCLWTRGLKDLIDCPVAHGEGQFLFADPTLLNTFQKQGQIALTYTSPDGSPAQGAYPANPNGSIADIAGVCNAQGNVLGLMPHPENHVVPHQHPRWSRGPQGRLGLRLFQNGASYVSY